MGQTWAKELIANPKTEIVAWIDIDPERAKTAALEHEIDPFISSSLSDAIAQTAPDFVVDVTVPEAHKDVTITALQAGLPVLGEKPMAHSLEAARSMISTSEKMGPLYMVSQSRRYNRFLVAYQNALSQIGNIGIVNSDFYLGPHFGGFRDSMDSPLIIDMAIHTFDAARMLIGSNPMTCWAHEFSPSWSWMNGASSTTIVFEFENGAVYTYRGSWVAEGLNTSWEAEWRVHGSLGAATWDGHHNVQVETAQHTGNFFSEVTKINPTIPDATFKEGISGSLEEFLNALDGGPTPQGECHDNFKSLQMVFAALESSRTQKTVKISDL